MRLFDLDRQLGSALERQGHGAEAVDGIADVIEVVGLGVIVQHDAAGNHALVYLGPDRAPVVSDGLVTTKHQERVTWPEMAAASATVERHAALSEALAGAGDIDALAAALLAPPLYVTGPGTFTAYSAIYRPAEGAVDYLWPGKRWGQSFDAVAPGRYEHAYGG